MSARAEQEIGEVVEVVRRRAPVGTAELAVVSILAVLRMEVFDVGIDRLVLVADLQAVVAEDLRVVHARIDHERILVLRVAVLPAERGIAADRSAC